MPDWSMNCVTTLPPNDEIGTKMHDSRLSRSHISKDLVQNVDRVTRHEEEGGIIGKSDATVTMRLLCRVIRAAFGDGLLRAAAMSGKPAPNAQIRAEPLARGNVSPYTAAALVAAH
mmetsp:Transcript_4836/g.13738  ORF Transcript_4836/g.13738 Transcript_4836/m.13738 type:complete len:116 (-) Transcript_4836:1145-1492(-)